MQVREVSHEAGKVVTVARAESLDKPLEWAVGFFFGNTELSLGLWTVIAGTPLVPSGRGYWWGGVIATATPADIGIYNKPEIVLAETPGTRQYNQCCGDQG
jgi:hypothetical protein